MQDRPAIIVLSSHVVRGTVGNRAAAFALEVLGHPVWTVPTVTLPWHPGHTPKAGPGTRIVAERAAFEAMVDDLAGSPWLGEVGGVLSGYLGAPWQVDAVARLVDAVQHRTPDALFALDPVMGDGERLYVPEQQARAIRETLLPRADLITPNRFELGTLTGLDTPCDEAAILDAARATGVRQVLTTSAPASTPDALGNLLACGPDAWLAENPYLARAPNGAGDLTAALMLSASLSGLNAEDALRRTTASVYEVLSHAVAEGADELLLERGLENLRAPTVAVPVRRVAGA